MGLDMYLEAEHFIWDFGEENETKAKMLRDAITNTMGETPGHVQKIVTEAAYWRKANAIHKWFVDNVQDGVDECQRSYVDRDQLKILRDLCQKIIDDPDDAKTNLPTESGFFFGGTDYDEWYIDDLKNTVSMLDNVLNEEKFSPTDWDFYYQSSW